MSGWRMQAKYISLKSILGNICILGFSQLPSRIIYYLLGFSLLTSGLSYHVPYKPCKLVLPWIPELPYFFVHTSHKLYSPDDFPEHLFWELYVFRNSSCCQDFLGISRVIGDITICTLQDNLGLKKMVSALLSASVEHSCFGPGFSIIRPFQGKKKNFRSAAPAQFWRYNKNKKIVLKQAYHEV